MKLTQTRKIYGGYRRTNGFLRSNAVLVSGMALPFVVVPTITLKAGVAISAAVLLTVNMLERKDRRPRRRAVPAAGEVEG